MIGNDPRCGVPQRPLHRLGLLPKNIPVCGLFRGRVGTNELVVQPANSGNKAHQQVAGVTAEGVAGLSPSRSHHGFDIDRQFRIPEGGSGYTARPFLVLDDVSTMYATKEPLVILNGGIVEMINGHGWGRLLLDA